MSTAVNVAATSGSLDVMTVQLPTDHAYLLTATVYFGQVQIDDGEVRCTLGDNQQDQLVVPATDYIEGATPYDRTDQVATFIGWSTGGGVEKLSCRRTGGGGIYRANTGQLVATQTRSLHVLP